MLDLHSEALQLQELICVRTVVKRNANIKNYVRFVVESHGKTRNYVRFVVESAANTGKSARFALGSVATTRTDMCENCCKKECKY